MYLACAKVLLFYRNYRINITKKIVFGDMLDKTYFSLGRNLDATGKRSKKYRREYDRQIACFQSAVN